MRDIFAWQEAFHYDFQPHTYTGNNHELVQKDERSRQIAFIVSLGVRAPWRRFGYVAHPNEGNQPAIGRRL
jgi:histone acetyltransferase (RNA polymerase elongator complex component)